jgi:hypothetical protein
LKNLILMAGATRTMDNYAKINRKQPDGNSQGTRSLPANAIMDLIRKREAAKAKAMPKARRRR